MSNGGHTRFRQSDVRNLNIKQFEKDKEVSYLVCSKIMM